MVRVSKREYEGLKKLGRDVKRTKRTYWAVESQSLMAQLKSINR